jgi:lipooligosaccharide transport system permease protein
MTSSSTIVTAPTANAPHLWRMPRISRFWWPVFLRNLLVWRKLFWPSLLGNTADPLITLVAFGYGMGALVGTVQMTGPSGGQAVPYILFLASGSICMSAMNAASFESMYSGFSRMQIQKTWDGMMNSPVSLDDVVFSEVMWAAYKSLFTVSAILLVMVALGISHQWTLLLALPLLLLTGACFAALAMIFTALAKGYDFFTYYFTLFLTPTMFLSGIFFPREQLPSWLATLATWLPLGLAVDLVRPLFMGVFPQQPAIKLIVLSAYTVAAFWIAMVLIRKRFKA